MARASQHEAPIAELEQAYDALEQDDVVAARSSALALLEAARGRNSQIEAHALSFLAHCDRLASQDLPGAIERCRQAARLFDQAGDLTGEVGALITLAHVTLVLGRNAESVEAALLAVRLSSGRAHRSTVLAYNILGLAYSWIGDDVRAHEALETAVRVAAQCDPPATAYQPRLNQMWVEVSRLQFDRYQRGSLGSLERLQKIASECERLGKLEANGALLPGLRAMRAALSHASMGFVAAWERRFLAAESEILQARRALPMYESWLSCFVACAEAELAWARGNMTEAASLLRSMKRIALAVGHEQLICRSHILLVQVYSQQGMIDAALQEHRHLRAREDRLVRDALRSREDLVGWQLDSRNRERVLRSALQHAEEAVRANDSKTRFLATASHDIRQPIHSMNVLIAALGVRDLDRETSKVIELLEAVNKALARQLDGLLDISKLDAGAVATNPLVQRLDAVVAAVHAMFEPLARGREIGLELLLDCRAFVRTDTALLTRLLSNLVDNSLKFTRRGGRVCLSATVEEGRAVVRVADTGIGIPQHALDRVFEEFFRVDDSRQGDTSPPGLGLGLSIVRRLAGLLDVAVVLESVPGSGTTVTLRMDTCADVQEEIVLRDRAPQLSGLGVLVVDDDSQVRQSMSVLLSALGARAYTAAGLTEAESAVRGCQIEILLTDWRLGEAQDASAVIEMVGRLRPDCRAIIVTADPRPEVTIWARERDLTVLRKPVSMDDLLPALIPRKVGA